jgi:hypothetical protein
MTLAALKSMGRSRAEARNRELGNSAAVTDNDRSASEKKKT